jgi:predicted metalloprotease with PDZ domain
MKLSYKLWILVTFPALAFWLASGCPGLAPQPDLVLHYRVEAVPGEGLLVELRVRGLSGRRPGFRLLDGWGMLQDQSRHIEDVSATDETGALIPVTLEAEDDEVTWRLRQAPQGEAVLRYRVSNYDPFQSPEATFVDGDRMILLGYSVFLLPERAPPFDMLPIEVEVRAPEEWPLWASWRGREGRYWPPTPHDLWSGVVAGGGFRPSQLGNDTVSVTVLTEAWTYGVTGLTIANRLLAVMRQMHRLFRAAPRGEDLRVLAVFRMLPRRTDLSIMTGNSEEGAFLCLATPDRYQDADPLTALATHECLHFYIGGAISANPEPPYRNSPDLIWFTEGITEYLTHRIMVEAGVLSAEGEAEVAARKDEEYRLAGRGRGLTMADAARQMENAEVYSLVYSRGYLVGRLLDRELARRCGEGTLETIVRDLFETHNFYRTRRAVDPKTVRARFERACPGIGSWITRYAEGNAALPPLLEPTAAADGRATAQ